MFGAGFNGLALPVALRALPSPLHDEKIYRSSLSHCREALAGILAEGDVVARATHWLAAHFRIHFRHSGIHQHCASGTIG